MKKYYYNSYRGFANEFDIISVDQNNVNEVSNMEKMLDRYRRSSNINWDLHQVSAARAKEIIRNERATKRSYLQAGLHLVNNPVGATEIISATEFFSMEQFINALIDRLDDDEDDYVYDDDEEE